MTTDIKKYPIADSIGFSSRRGEKVLSNMDCSCPLVYDGVEYNSAEQLFHVLLYKRVAELAMQCQNGKEVKRLNALYMEDRDYRWDTNDDRKRKREQYYMDMYNLLHICHQVKFKCNEKFRKVILESGDKFLVEDCHWLDGTRIRGELYGTRRDEKNGVFIGRNINGQSLMLLRDEVLKDEVSNEIVEEPQKPIKRHLEPSDALSERLPLKVVSMKGKKQKLFIQRVECNAYDDLGFSRYHYIDKPINKAAMCFLVTTAKGQPLAFLGFLNHTFRGCSNGMKVSRFIILPHHQGKGLALTILSAVCGMLKSRGYRVFINTENPKLGESLVNSTDYRCTTFNCVNRTIKMDDRYKHRRSGTAYRVEYIGDGVHGYSQLLGKVAEIRAKRESTQPKMEGKVYVIPTYYGYVTSATCDMILQYIVNSSIMCSDSHIVEYTMSRARGTPMAA